MDGEIDYNELYGLEPEKPADSEAEESQGEAGEVAETPPEAGAEGPEPEVPGNAPPAEGGAGRDSGETPTPLTPPDYARRRVSEANRPEGAALGPEMPSAAGPVGRGGANSAPEPGPLGRGRQSEFRDDEADAYLDGVIKGLGLVDPYSNTPIATRAQYEAYQKKLAEERKKQILQRSGMSESEFAEFVAALPEVREAKAAQAQAEAMIRRQREAEAKARVDAEIGKIAALDPEVRSLADLTGKDYSPRLTELVRRGYDLSDAYRLANFDKLQQRAAQASRQAAYNAQTGKAGMTATKQAGQGNDSVPVPRDVLEMYRAMNPEMSDADIRADYNKYLKGRK